MSVAKVVSVSQGGGGAGGEAAVGDVGVVPGRLRPVSYAASRLAQGRRGVGPVEAKGNGASRPLGSG
jgi:hypothetical protein